MFSKVVNAVFAVSIFASVKTAKAALF